MLLVSDQFVVDWLFAVESPTRAEKCCSLEASGGNDDDNDNDDGDGDDDDNDDDWVESDEAILPLKLIRLLEKKSFWRKRSYVGGSEVSAQRLYARVHQDPVLFRNLYNYIVFR